MRQNNSDGFDKKNLEDENFSTSSKIPGNTLDYYNDDLSRNAVQGLFSESEKASKGSFVSGYDDEEPLPPRSIDTSSPAVRRRVSTPSRFESEDKPSAFDSAEGLEEKKKARPEVPGGRASRTERNDIEEIDYNRYRVRERSRGHQEQPKAGPTPSRGVVPAIQIDEKERRAPYTTFKKEAYRPSSAPAGEADDDMDDTEESMSFTKIIAISVSVVVLIIFATLIFKINSTNSKLDLATKQLEEVTAAGDVNELKMKNDELQSKVNQLTQELEARKTGPQPNESTDSDVSPDDSTAGPSETSSGTSPSGRSYTVKSGDTLSKISTEFYGTIKEVDKIKEANNLPNNNLKVGQVLIIP